MNVGVIVLVIKGVGLLLGRSGGLDRVGDGCTVGARVGVREGRKGGRVTVGVFVGV